MEPKRTRTQAEAKQVFDAAKRAVGIARTGVPLEAAIQDTAMQSGVPSYEIAEVINIMLDALAARKMVDAHEKTGA